MNTIKNKINQIRASLARRQEILNNEKKRRTLFAAGLMQFNCGKTCLNGNRERDYGKKKIANVIDKTAFFK